MDYFLFKSSDFFLNQNYIIIFINHVTFFRYPHKNEGLMPYVNRRRLNALVIKYATMPIPLCQVFVYIFKNTQAYTHPPSSPSTTKPTTHPTCE